MTRTTATEGSSKDFASKLCVAVGNVWQCVSKDSESKLCVVVCCSVKVWQCVAVCGSVV